MNHETINLVGIHTNPRPGIAPTLILLLVASVFLLRADELPNLIDLNSTRLHVANVLIVILAAHRPDVGKQLEDGRLGDASHSHRGANAVALDKCRDHRNPLGRV